MALLQAQHVMPKACRMAGLQIEQLWYQLAIHEKQQSNSIIHLSSGVRPVGI